MAKGKWEDVKEKFSDIEKWLKKGLYEYQICKKIGIGKTAWEKYKNEHPELKELLKKGKEIQINEISRSLYKTAKGYSFYVDEAVKLKDEKGNERVEVIRLKKFQKAETAAIIFYLKNRSKFEWCDNPQMLELKKQELEIRKLETEIRNF